MSTRKGRFTVVRALLGACMLAVSLIGAAQAGEDASLVLRVKFDEKDISKYHDELTGTSVAAHNARPVQGVDGLGTTFLFDYKGGIATRIEIPVTPKLKRMDTTRLSWEFWFSPVEDHYSQIFNVGEPVTVRWRLGHFLWFTLTTHDKEVRRVIAERGCIPALTFPEPTWYHFMGTYDGEEGRIYINGRLVGRKKFKGKKKLLPFEKPFPMGGSRWNRYRGGLDEFSVYNRVFTAAQVAARYEAAKKTFKPAPQPEKKNAGTRDGEPFKKEWCRIPLKGGFADFSNTGLLTLTSRNPRWGHNNVVGYWGISNSHGMKGRYWTELTGFVKVEAGGRTGVELEGTSYRGLGIKMKMDVTADDEIRYTYTLWPAGERAPKPVVTWPFHLWYSAIPFVGYDKDGRKVWGRMIDLAETFVFTKRLELNVIKGGNRLLADLPDGWGYVVPATREPSRWLGGYATFYARMEPLRWEGWSGYSKEKPYTFRFSLKLIGDEKPPVLSKKGAELITPELPFDFTNLYKPDASKVYLEPQGRDVPIFSHDEDVEFRINLPPGVSRKKPSCDYTVLDAYSLREIAKGSIGVDKKWWEFNGIISFKPPGPSVYLVRLKCVGPDGAVLAELEQEAAVVGPIEQPVAELGRKLKRKLVDRVDCTREDATHDFYSRSGRSRVVDTPAGKVRRTLDNKEMIRLGTNDLDWFGYRFKLADPTKVHVIEVDYPDDADRTMGIIVYEGDERRFNGKPASLSRVSSGVSTGGMYPVSNRMKTFSTIFFPTTSWCAVSVSNIHCGSYRDGPPAAAAAIRVYQLTEPLPRLPATGAGAGRLIGVYAESGELGMGPFGYNELRSEFWDDHKVPKERFYREHYRAIANMIRYMRYRGDTVYGYGAYRYRSSRFPSVHFPPGHSVMKGELLALMARMFEYNELKVLPAIQANQPLPVSRLLRRSLYEIVQGTEPSVAQVSSEGVTRAGHFGFTYTNPFHPLTRAEWLELAREIGRRYADYKAVAGIGWLTGTYWSPALLTVGYKLKKDKIDSYYFGYTYDDETMRQFAAEEKLKLPGKPGDPKRFNERYKWIMKNARDKWIAFRSRKLAELYKSLAGALHSEAPQTKFYVVGQHPGPLMNEIVAPPLETWRMAGFDPRDYKGIDGLVYVQCVPDGSGLNVYEHGSMPREWMKQIRPFLDDAALYAAVESVGASGRFLHRQFFENRLRYDPKRPWIFGRGGKTSEPLRLNHNFYPLPSGRNNLEDFALIMAHGAPEFIIWMWCDGTVPMGNEDTLREFAAFYRSLPIGEYETVKEVAGLFVRKLKGGGGGKIYYLVNTNRKPAVIRFEAEGRTAVDLVTGETIKAENGRFPVSLKAAGMRSFHVE